MRKRDFKEFVLVGFLTVFSVGLSEEAAPVPQDSNGSINALVLPGEPFVNSYLPTNEGKSGMYEDPRDGNNYKWIKIGEQIWLAENLRFKTESGSWCWEHKQENCLQRGRLYNWQAAHEAPPPGWHLPSDQEWKELELSLGLTKGQIDLEGFRVDKDSLLAGKIKLVGTWLNEYNGNALYISNATGFSAIPTGFYANDEFTHEGYTAWWSSDGNATHAWIRHIGFHDNTIGRVLNRKEFAFPVRCIKN